MGLQPLWTLAAFLVSQFYTQSVGVLGRGISPSQGRYLDKEQYKCRLNTQRHPCLEWDSNPGAGEDSSCLRPRGPCDLLNVCLGTAVLFDFHPDIFHFKETSISVIQGCSQYFTWTKCRTCLVIIN
jgi:hypothetical protein